MEELKRAQGNTARGFDDSGDAVGGGERECPLGGAQGVEGSAEDQSALRRELVACQQRLAEERSARIALEEQVRL